MTKIYEVTFLSPHNSHCELATLSSEGLSSVTGVKEYVVSFRHN